MLAKRGKKVNGISGGIYDENTLELVIPAVATSVGTAVNPGAGTAAGASLGAVMVKLIPIIVEVLQMVAPAEVSDAIVNQTLGGEDLKNEDEGQQGTVQSSGGVEIWYENINWTYVAIGSLAAYYLFLRKK